MLLTAYSAPPEKAKIPPMGKTISRSVLRTDRTGPTTVGIRELKIAAKRVMPPSTISSYTTSASCTPLWGNAWGVLSILIVRAERCFVTFDGSGRSVSGATGPGFFFATVVVVAILVEVVVVDVEAASALVASTRFEHEPMTSTMRSERRMNETYRVSRTRP